MEGKYYNLWSTDNDRTVPNDDVVIKSVYDPSPIGYSLPASNAFTGFTDTGLNTGNPGNPAIFNVKGSYDKGWYFYTKLNRKGNTFFLPASGFRYYSSGAFSGLATYGFYFVAGTSTYDIGRYFFFRSFFVFPLDGSYRSDGLAVRSTEEKKLKYELDEIANGVWVKGGL